jgi:hypothetical protein
MARLAWPYIYKFLRLKDPELIKRWEVLSRYAADLPAGSGFVTYRSVLDTSRVVSARREKGTTHLVWFHVVSAEDAAKLASLQEGQEATPFFNDFKVSTRYPFIMSNTDAATLTVRNGQPALPADYKRRRFTLTDAFRRARTIHKTTFFTPTVAELDSLLAYLEHAEPLNPGGN